MCQMRTNSGICLQSTVRHTASLDRCVTCKQQVVAELATRSVQFTSVWNDFTRWNIFLE